ncbi:alpha/beta hydrolase domain-containing protein [Bradyrhizobium sp. LHD-71]|uniref:alpha/beta hydrolase domain-containing protein n=1 Tax=Bradyrhizobium sp. LHD-71 TaxID=3072141 RepID=UPI00280E9A53|nr:alpha/beta hydrolase domain-containing protein [Bradyrhizobium sp. LHD-71]MDQ8731791.1 alpha/beta hydrolase domain-containing protein [Bradyrhizobium sp. LHD-71]
MDIRIDSIQPFAEGHAFGKTGVYERLKGVAHGTLDPNDPQNTPIVDLEKAPRDANGRVVYEIDLEILRPIEPERGNGVILYEVTNRGNKLIGRLNGVTPADPANPFELNDPVSRAHAGTGLLFERGLTLIWSGWDPTLASRNALMTVRFPLAFEDGKPMVRRIREEFQVGKRIPSSDSIVLTYPAASLDKDRARLMMRRRETDKRIEIPRDQWEFADARHVRLLPEETQPTPLTIYEFWYEATNSHVAGIAFTAVRDLVSFLRYAPDSPLAASKPRHAIAFGISQSGRYLRHFLDLHMNRDLAGRRVFDGVHAHTGGDGKTFINHSFAEPNRTISQHVDHLYPEAWFPFAAAPGTDPFSGRTGSLFQGDGTDPLLIQSNTSAEYWEKGASLLTIDGLGKTDLVMPATTRTYLIAGTQHAGALPTAPRGPNANAVNWQSPLPAVRALLVAMEDWVVRGIAPPESHVPSIADGTAVDPATIRFPTAPDFALPCVHGSNRTTPVDWIDPPGSPDNESGKADGAYVTLVSAVDPDGNEVAGIRLPPVAVPLATFTGWNVFRDLPDEFADRDGSFVLFARTKAEREATADTRLSLAERYRSLDDYVSQVKACVDRLVADRLLLLADAAAYVEAAKACRAFASAPAAAAK